MKYIYQQAGRRFFVWIKHSIGYLWMVFLAGYLAINVGQSVYETYQVKQETFLLRKQLEYMKLEKVRLESLLMYYQSDTYKEKELRRSLLLKKPNEKVFALPEYDNAVSVLDNSYFVNKLVEEENNESAMKDAENWKKWLEYLF